MLFLDYLNNRHPNIGFTYEKQLEGKRPFLDILVDNSSPFSIMSIMFSIMSTYSLHLSIK